jgi:hypothetical protein
VASRGSKRLVIDTTVARAAGGEEATSPTSSRCRDFLTAVLRVCHKIVLTPALNEEWKRHLSNFTRKWRVSMEARKKVHREDDPPQHELRDKLEQAASGDKARETMLKDWHLVEAALLTDGTIVSLDDEVRGLFSVAATAVGELRPILWANPGKEEEEVFAWLEKGAPAEKERRLGYRAVKKS